MSAQGPDTAPAQRARTLATAATRHPPSRGAGRAATKDGEPRGGAHEAQRARLVAAAVEIAAEAGYTQLSVTGVVARAGVSRGTFYELFANREELFLEAFDDAVARLEAAVERGGAVQRRGATGQRKHAEEGEWEERVRAGLEAVLGVLDEQPALARVCVVEAPRAGTKVQRRRAEILDGFARIVEQGREGGTDDKAGREPGSGRERPGGARERRGGGPPPLTAQSLVAGAASVVQERLMTPAAGPLAELAGPLASMIVFPYRGPAAAARELQRPARTAKRPVKL